MTRRPVDSARSIGEGEAMMTTDGPAWGAWTTHYDPVGQAPSMIRFDDESGLIVSGFSVQCLMLDNRPGAVGAAPSPPVPPVPVTVGLQARRRFADEFAHLTFTGFDVLIVRS
jgi:hypothetical protein